MLIIDFTKIRLVTKHSQNNQNKSRYAHFLSDDIALFLDFDNS